MSLIKKPFYFMRHGQTDWNTLRLALGQNNMPLNAVGIEQARKAQSLLENLSIDVICHSPIKRAKQTAQIVNETIQSSLVELEDLKECHWGSFEGKPIGNWMQQWMDGELKGDIEDRQCFISRLVNGMNQALSHDGTILIVGHGAFYWTMQSVMNIEPKHDIESCVPAYHSSNGDMWKVTNLKI